MTQEQFKTLEAYYPICHATVVNQAASCFTLKMKEELLTILKSEGKAAGICGKCGSGIIEIATRATHLYHENKDKFKEEDNAETKEPQVKKRRRRQEV